jgi:hypothetical protein
MVKKPSYVKEDGRIVKDYRAVLMELLPIWAIKSNHQEAWFDLYLSPEYLTPIGRFRHLTKSSVKLNKRVYPNHIRLSG